MACSNCNTQNCGCSGTYVVSQTCPPACSEVFNSACIVYTGVDIICNDTTVSPAVPTTIVHRNDYLDTALTAIVNYMCSRFNTQIHPTTVVDSGDAFILVSSDVVGAQTTYTISLDPTNLPQASEVTGGVNVTVTGDGTPTTDPYVVNAQGSIVAVAPGTALSVIADADTPGPFDTTYTIDIDYDQLPDVSLITSQGYISITEQPGVPNAGDTQYTLDVDQVTVTAADVRLTSTETAAGGAPNFLRTFDVAIDETEMTHWIMESVIYAPGNVGPGLIEGPGISLNWNPATYQLEIENLFSDPHRWFTLADFLGTTVIPTADNAILSILADPATVALGGSGIDAVLSGTGTAAQYDLLNTDPGSGQLTFVDVTCSNVSGTVGGTASAAVNGDVLTLVGGTDIDLTVLGNQITIDNLIDRVYSEIQSDAGDTLQAPNTTSTFTIAGGTGIGTIGDLASQTITINNEALVYDTITGDTGSTTASGLNDSLAIVSSGAGCSTTVTADTITIENTGVTSAIAGDGIAVSAATGAVTVSSTDALVVLRDMNILAGVVQFPSDNATTGECDVTTAGINSNFMQVQIVDQATGTIQDITGGAVAGIGLVAGIFSVAGAPAAGFADGSYRIIVTGNRV